VTPAVIPSPTLESTNYTLHATIDLVGSEVAAAKERWCNSKQDEQFV